MRAAAIEVTHERADKATLQQMTYSLKDRLEAAEKDVTLKERVIDALGSDLNAVSNERDTLRAKITEMEQQKPVGTTEGMPGTTGFTMSCFHADKVPIGSKLYTLPGAKGEEK